MARDVGNRLAQASRLSITSQGRTYRNLIGAGDAEDWYRLRLKTRSHIQLTLKGLRNNADLELVRDDNRNRELDFGEIVASSRSLARRPDQIEIRGLSAGTYYLRVFASGNRTRYRLRAAAKPVAQPDFTYDVVQRTNAIRASRGLHRLAVNTQLTQAAQRYAKQMAMEDFFSHQGIDGSTWQQRIRATGYEFSDAAENLAIGHRTPTQVINGWMNSPGHRANMLAHQVQEIGVGYFFMPQDRGRVVANHYWAESFGTPTGSQFGNAPADPIDRDLPGQHRDRFFDKLDR